MVFICFVFLIGLFFEKKMILCLMLCYVCSVWVARRPPGYAFIDFDDRRDAQDAIRELDGMFRRIMLLECNRIKIKIKCA